MSQPQSITSSTQSLSMAQEPNNQRPEALYQSYHAQVQNLKQLPVPYSDLYRALASYESTELHSLSANFREMAADLSLWLETAEKAVFSLEMDIQKDGANGRQDVSELDLIMSRFHPNIDMLRELKEKIKSRLQTTAKANLVTDGSTEGIQLADKASAQDALISEQELERTATAIQSSWSTLNSMMGRVKGVLASVRVRGDLLTQMEVVLAEVEEIGLDIDSFREKLARQALDAGASRASQSISSPPYLLPSVTAESFSSSADEIKAKQPDTEALTVLDSRIETLGTTIDALTGRIESLPLDAPKRDELREHYAQLLRLWDDGKARREKINVEMKERRWLAVFEQVAGQVESMMESVDRAVVHCKGLIDQIKVMVKDKVIPAAPIDREHLFTIFKSFEAKHKYYAPAINKMLNMLENGIESRMTRDPDVIEKHQNMKERWDHLRGGLDQVELDMSSIEKMLDILDASIPSYVPTPPAQLPEKPLFAMRRSQTTGWQPSGPPSLFQPPEQGSPQTQRGRRPQPSSSGLQTPDDSPMSERARPINIPTRPRPWSPSPSVSSLPSMLSPNMFNSYRSHSRNSSRSPSRRTSDKPRPWCPSTSTSSPSIPGIPHAPSAAATYRSRSPSSAGHRRDTSPSPAPSTGTGTVLSRARSVSCTPSLSRSPSQQRPAFSPAGSLSKLSTGVQATRSTSPAPRATSPAPRSTSPAPAVASDRKSSLRLPPPVATNGSRLRQHSAPGLPSNVQRRSSSPGPGHHGATTQVKPNTRPPFAFSSSTQSSRGSSNSSLRENNGEEGHSRPRTISFGNTSSNLASGTSKSERTRTGAGSGRGFTAGSASNTDGRLNGTSSPDEPTSPTTSLASSVISFAQPRNVRPEPAHPTQGVAKLSAKAQDMSLQEPMAPYMPIRGDELDEEFGKMLNTTPVPVQVRRVGEGKYYFGGRVEEQTHGGLSVAGGKMVLCRLMEYGRVNSNNDDDSGVSSGGSHSSVEDDLQQQQQQQQKTSQLQQPRWNALSKVVSVLRRPEPAHSRASRPRARSVNNAPSATVGKSSRKVMVRVGGGWQELNVFLSDLAAKSSQA